MTRNRYQPQNTQILEAIPYETRLPLDRPVANYYRQSTDEQVGNISTILQTVDMPIYLQRLGWKPDKIRMIDMDEGVSGTTKIDEREGMRLLFDLITSDQLGAVACQDEDRLFRDVTQIQVNIFIEACRSHRVLVITPTMIYDFAHATYGTFHARQFRFKSEMAADYIQTVILGKLHAAKKNLAMSGRWSGAPIPVGFMVDMRKTLGNGVPNEQYRKFEVFEPYAEIIREYFRMFLANAGRTGDTLRQIQSEGPYFPDPGICKPPDGFKIAYPLVKNQHGWCYKTKTGLRGMLILASYIGHWVVKDTVVRWNNHPAIVDDATFYRTFNYLSAVNLDGSDNPHFRPNRIFARPTLEKDREVGRPLYTGLMFSMLEGEWKSVGTVWDGLNRNYDYVFYGRDPFIPAIWQKRSDYVDHAISSLLLEKLQRTFNFDTWSTALEIYAHESEQQQQLKRKQLTHLETVMLNLAASLESLTTPGLIAQIEKRYQDAQAEYQRLQQDIGMEAAPAVTSDTIRTLKTMYAQLIENWDTITTQEKRELIHVFVGKIEATKGEKHRLALTIYWQDGSTDDMDIRRLPSSGLAWMPQEHALLVKLGQEGAGQIEIARTFPNRTWLMIARKHRKLTGRYLTWGGNHPIKGHETYEDYVRRCQDGGTLDMTLEAGSSGEIHCFGCQDRPGLLLHNRDHRCC